MPRTRRFPITRRIEGLPRTRLVLGPCPGCQLWTVEYDLGNVWSNWGPEEFEAVVENLLREHADECPGLREIIEILRLEESVG